MDLKKIFSRPLPDASVPRNGFDKSRRTNFHLPFGAILPCFHDVAIAGSHFEIDVKSFFRTAQVNTASFPRLKMETEFFAVPIRFLWSYWDNFKLGVQDYNSTALNEVEHQSFVQYVPNVVPTWYSALLDNLIRADYVNWSQSPQSPTYYRDSVGLPWFAGAMRLRDMLGYGRYNPVDAPSEVTQGLSLFMIAAYQKIYFDHFRNTAYESNNPVAYNLDWMSRQDHNDLYGDDANYYRQFFTLRYANYRKDYFQHIFPSLNFVKSEPRSPFDAIPSWVQNVGFQQQTGDDYGRWVRGFDGSSLGDGNEVNTSSNGYLTEKAGDIVNRLSHTHLVDRTYLSYSPQAIRAAFALDKLQRSSAYAPKHVKDQYEARYGIKFPASSSFESQRIGSFDTDIVIGEVTSTANTVEQGGDLLGAIGGKGVGGRNYSHRVSFDVKEDSIILGVCYAIPRTSYDSYRIDNWNMKLGKRDFFIPEFMNLGLKPLYHKEFCTRYNRGVNGGRGSWLSSEEMNTALGFQYPYMEYKCAVDENHGLFAELDSDLGQFVVHSNSQWRGSVSSDGVSYDYFKVKPSDLNSIFVAASDGTESTDHLFGEMEFSNPVVQNMSVHGQPSL